MVLSNKVCYCTTCSHINTVKYLKSLPSTLLDTMNTYSDPFGFNKQTATLLHGLGAPELIPQCKKRNISTDVLHELNVQELVILGIDPKKAEELHSTINVRKRRSGIVITSVEDRTRHFIDIIKQGKRQFSLIQAFVAYCRLRLVKERVDTFIDPNKCLTASKILPISISATMTEIEDANKSLCEIEHLILGLKVKPKHNKIRKVCACISVLGVVVLILFKCKLIYRQ